MIDLTQRMSKQEIKTPLATGQIVSGTDFEILCNGGRERGLKIDACKEFSFEFIEFRRHSNRDRYPVRVRYKSGAQGGMSLVGDRVLVGM